MGWGPASQGMVRLASLIEGINSWLRGSFGHAGSTATIVRTSIRYTLPSENLLSTFYWKT